MDTFFISSLILGAAAGLSAGLFGIGGGIIIVPILAWMLKSQGISEDLVMIMAIATSLATIIFTSISSVAAHQQKKAVWWQSVWYLSWGIVIGVAGGAVIAEHINAEHLRLIFAIFLFYVAMQMLLKITPRPGENPESAFSDYLMGIITGVVSSILGIGGGTLTVPYLVIRRVPMQNAVAISSACGLPIAIAASISYAILGFKHGNLPEHSFGYIYLPAFWGIAVVSVVTAPLGAKLAHRLSAENLKRYFAVVLFMLAAKMLWH